MAVPAAKITREHCTLFICLKCELFWLQTREGRARLRNMSCEGWWYRSPGTDLQPSLSSGGSSLGLLSNQFLQEPEALATKWNDPPRSTASAPSFLLFDSPITVQRAETSQRRRCLMDTREGKTSSPSDVTPAPRISQGFQASPKHPTQFARALSRRLRWIYKAALQLPGLTHVSSAIYAETAAQGLLLFFTPTVATGYQSSPSAGWCSPRTPRCSHRGSPDTRRRQRGAGPPVH